MDTMRNNRYNFLNHACRMNAPPEFHLLLAGFVLLTRFNQPGVTNIAAVPAGERPVLDEVGVHHYFDEDIEQGNSLKLLKLIVADLAQLLVKSLGVSELQQVLPHGIEFVALKHVRQPPSIEYHELRLNGLFGGRNGPEV